MTPSITARLALALLHHLSDRNEPLVGDLLEQYRHGRSTFWLWRQIVLGLALGSFCHQVPTALNLTPIDPAVAEWLMDRKLNRLQKRVNLTGTGVEGVGGLGLVMLGALMSTVVPAIWWFYFGGIASGLALGAAMVYLRSTSHKPSSCS